MPSLENKKKTDMGRYNASFYDWVVCNMHISDV
jgi:hypothetical protein